MPPPTITCAVCKNVVNKRASVLVEPLGRICRNHPEAEAHKEKLAELAKKDADDRASQAKWKQAQDGFNKMMFVEQLRTLAAYKGVPMGLVILAFGHRIPESIRDAVIDEARVKGPLSEEEQNNAISMAAYMISKKIV